jgi:hypothetical protein
VIAHLSPALSWTIPAVACAPWLVGIVWAWRRRPADGYLPPSLGERSRRRLRAL